MNYKVIYRDRSGGSLQTVVDAEDEIEAVALCKAFFEEQTHFVAHYSGLIKAHPENFTVVRIR